MVTPEQSTVKETASAQMLHVQEFPYPSSVAVQDAMSLERNPRSPTIVRSLLMSSSTAFTASYETSSKISSISLGTPRPLEEVVKNVLATKTPSVISSQPLVATSQSQLLIAGKPELSPSQINVPSGMFSLASPASHLLEWSTPSPSEKMKLEREEVTKPIGSQIGDSKSTRADHRRNWTFSFILLGSDPDACCWKDGRRVVRKSDIF